MKIQSVHRALDIVSLFISHRPVLGLTEIASALDLNKTTAYGLIASLVEKGFLSKDPRTKQYRLGSKVYELGLVFSSSLEINRVAAGPVQLLAEKTQQTPRIAILEGLFAFVTLFALPGGQTNISNQVGPRLPLYCTALGKAFLAFSDQQYLDEYLKKTELIPHTEHTLIDPEKLRDDLRLSAKRGFSVSRGELVKGHGGIAAPIRGYQGRLEGALVISGKKKEILGDDMDRYVEEMLSTASSISNMMGFSHIG